jgi:hypothetical protein
MFPDRSGCAVQPLIMYTHRRHDIQSGAIANPAERGSPILRRQCPRADPKLTEAPGTICTISPSN